MLTNSRAVVLFLLTAISLDQAPVLAVEPAFQGAGRVVFLGDSITYAGQAIELTEAFLRAVDPSFHAEFLNLGLPSETVSGLSEPGHAGGSFPRPVLRERLKRVLEQTKPDIVVACYGMNDGIYYPWSEERFEAYRKGMIELRDAAKAAGVKRVVHVTPPVFDALPIKDSALPAGLAEYPKPFVGYDGVLTRYAQWLVGQRANGWDVVDTHTPLKVELERQRKADPAFRFADDGVHLNAAGHWQIARTLLKHWGASAVSLGEEFETPEAVFGRLKNGQTILELVQKRQRVLKDAYLTSIGHLRPGMNRGVPLAAANAEGERLTTALDRLADAPK